MVRIRPDGSKQIVAELPEIRGNTSAVFGETSLDRDKLYVIGDGGLFFGGKAPATLIRLDVGVAGPAR